jgi:hypothetical protein
MTKNHYKKEPIKISYWVVTLKDIERIYSFFQERFKEDNFNIEIEVESGHTKSCENYKEFNEIIYKLLEDKEIIKNITILHSTIGSNYYNSKQVWVTIPFNEKFDKPSLFIIGGDEDGSYSDWIEATFNRAKKLMESFSEDNEVIKQYLDNNKLSTILDLDGSMKEKIINDAKKEEDKKHSAVSINTTIFTNNGQIGGESNIQKFQNNTSDQKKWYETFWGIFYTTIITSLITAGIAYYLGWN